MIDGLDVVKVPLENLFRDCHINECLLNSITFFHAGKPICFLLKGKGGVTPAYYYSSLQRLTQNIQTSPNLEESYVDSGP